MHWQFLDEHPIVQDIAEDVHGKAIHKVAEALMTEDSRLPDLVTRWENLRDAGEEISPEELCQDCPELLSELARRVAALRNKLAPTAHADTLPWDGNSGKAGDNQPEPTLNLNGGIPGYTVLRELGRGGMGVVYLARQTALGRLVALKMLLAGKHAAPAERARFKTEVEAIGRLQHPNLVQVFEVGEHDGRAFFSMEFLEGGNLEDRMAYRPQPARQSAEMVELLARAIHAAHQHGVVHRDLKPANVLLSAGGIPKISDFGLAKRLDVASELTLTQHVLGTPSYMAPEQASGRSKEVGPATDVYALGAILYEMLTARPPFMGEGAMDVVRQVLEEDPLPPRRLQPGIPADLETICMKCLRKPPANRYASAAALAEDLRRFLADEPILARPIGWLGRLLKWARRRPAAAGLISLSSVALIAALAAGSWFTQRLASELQKTDLARRDLEQALTRRVAEGLDADLRQLEMVPQTMAALLSRRLVWNDADLEAWTASLVDKDKRVFGLGVAFEPGQLISTTKHQDYCLYIHEHEGGLATKQLLPPLYPPPFYRLRDWYTSPKAARAPTWGEPYVGQGANNTPMLTYSVPILRDGVFCGVVTADVSIEYFRGLHTQLHSQYLGPNSYSFVISPKGTFIYHPDLQYEFPAPASSLDRIKTAPDFRALIERMRREESGQGQATDFTTGRSATFLFTRLVSTRWHFVVVRQ